MANNNKPKKEKPLWDSYYDRQQKVLVTEMDFDFEAIAGCFNRITNTSNYTESEIQKRWAELHAERKKEKGNVMDQLMAKSKDNQNILQLMDELTDQDMKNPGPQPRNFLKVNEEDLEKARSVSALTGELIKPTGKFSYNHDTKQKQGIMCLIIRFTVRNIWLTRKRKKQSFWVQ